MTMTEEEYLEKIDRIERSLIDKAVIWVDENVGSLTSIALRKHLEE